MNCIVTSWSDFNPEIDAMPKRLTWKQQRAWIYKNLLRRRKQRFSCFEVGDNMQAAKRLGSMIRQGIVEVTGGDFPWSTYKLHVKRTKPKPLPLIRFGDGAVLMLEAR